MPLSIYASVNNMVPKLLHACPDFDQSRLKYGADRLMYDLGHYVVAQIQAGECTCVFALSNTLEEVLDTADRPVRSSLGVLIGAIIANGSLNQVSVEPMKSCLGHRGARFWQEREDFLNSSGPLRYEEGTY
jgi:hypothetical protein